MKIKRIAGKSPDVYDIIAPWAMDATVIRNRGNLPIITKETYTWHVLMKGKEVKAFVAVETVTDYLKLQAFIVLNASNNELLELLDDVILCFRRTNSPKLTVSVLHDYVAIFQKKKFEIVNRKKNWTDLELRQ